MTDNDVTSAAEGTVSATAQPKARGRTVKRPGRPSKVAPGITAKVCEAIRAGSPREFAVARAGLAKDTFYAWLRRGARALAAADGDPSQVPAGERPYADFSDAVEKALADAVFADVSLIRQAAEKGAWQAAAWRLERMHPEHFGRRDRMAVEQPGHTERTVDLRKLTDAELDELARLAEKAAPDTA